MTEEREGFEGADLVTQDRAYIAANDRERARMRDLVEGLDEAALRTRVNDHWTVAAVLVWENRWAAPVAVALRRSGGQLVASGRIPVQAILASLDASEAVN